MIFEKVAITIFNFKYLEVDVNKKPNSHAEINRRVITGNKCYFQWYHCINKFIIKNKN